MFCPNCGKGEQSPETYCRRCGILLPDLSKPNKRQIPPEQHIKANTILSLMTVVVSFTLSALLYLFLGFRSTTPPLIYATGGLLIAIGAWHIQSLIRIQLLKKQWKRRTTLTDTQPPASKAVRQQEATSTAKLLDQADFASAVPSSITENTTRNLVDTPSQK